MQDAKEEIRSRLAIEDIVGEYIPLKRAGRLWKGLSPFTNERTPSFIVTPERNIWHDFSSDRGGDIYSFIMEMEGVDFRGAMEILARKAGVDLSQYDTKNSKDISAKKQRILSMNEVAVNYFQQNLIKNKVALDYVKSRKLKKETIIEWKIGYAPEDANLKGLLVKKGFSQEEIRGAGLIGPRGGEMFRGRLMIPLCDGQGQVVGFTGRIIGDGEPKYLNTPQTLLYDKGRQVFGMHLAKKAIREAGEVVICEGNLDVISSHQAGVKSVVATAGTAITADHLKSLSRLTDKIVLCFDADKAGVAATERAIPLAQAQNLQLNIISIDGAKDPDELINQGADKWREVIANQKPAVEWIIDIYEKRVDIKTAEGKKKLANAALGIVRKINDPVEREHYIKLISGRTDISVMALNAKLAGNDTEMTTTKVKANKVQKNEIDRNNIESYLNYIFAAALKHGATRSRTLLNNIPERYLSENWYKVWMFITKNQKEMIDEEIVKYKIAELELIADQKIAEPDGNEVLDYYRNLELVNYKEDLRSLREQFATEEETAKLDLINKTINSYNKIVNKLERTGINTDFDELFALWESRKQ